MLKHRIITALVLVALTLWALFYSSDMAWKITLLVVALVAAWEWAGFTQYNLPVLKWIYAFAVVVTANFAVDVLSTENITFLVVFELVVVLSVVHRYQRSKGQVGTTSDGLIMLAGAVAIVLFTVSLVKFRAEFGAVELLASFMVIWAIDTGAYFSGRRFGKNKLAEYVSPGKTWEGVYGGTLLAFFIAWVLLAYIEPNTHVALVLFALALTFIAVISVYGDLFESVLKRQAGLKDSGKILPGHGGVLDRVDSLLISAPLLYLAWFFLLS